MIRAWLPALFIACQPCLLYASSTAPPHAIQACVDFECETTAPFRFSPGQWQVVTGFFAQTKDAIQERDGIRNYIAYMEQIVGESAGTWRDRGRNDPNVSPLGQLDCIAESTNTTTYLGIIESAGLLRWHDLLARRVRNRWWVNVHWTAVIRERASGAEYAVDSWFRNNGAQPAILPLDAWLAGADETDEKEGR